MTRGSLKVLYLGDNEEGCTSAHRAEALRRLGHRVIHLDPRDEFLRKRIFSGLSTRVGFWPIAPFVSRRVKREIGDEQFDLAWVDCGAELSPGLHRWMRKQGMKIINYNADDPFSSRDGQKWNLYRSSARYHDLTVVVRKENVKEAHAFGSQRVLRIFRSFDPVAHRPIEPTMDARRRWTSEVAFTGTWVPERGPFFARLLELGVPLTIRGLRWEKAAELEKIAHAWRGPAVFGSDYVAATQFAEVAIGLLSKGNRDLHTTRSAEIPAIGGAVFCAERTDEHRAMLEEGVEAEFFDSPEECAKKCFELLADGERRQRMALAAQAKIRLLRLSNDEVMNSILQIFHGESESAAWSWGCEVWTNGDDDGE